MQSHITHITSVYGMNLKYSSHIILTSCIGPLLHMMNSLNKVVTIKSYPVNHFCVQANDYDRHCNDYYFTSPSTSHLILTDICVRVQANDYHWSFSYTHDEFFEQSCYYQELSCLSFLCAGLIGIAMIMISLHPPHHILS